MKLDDIIALGKIDALGSQIAEAHKRSPTFNAPLALARAEGREKEPELAGIIASYENQNPINHGKYIHEYVGANAGVLTEAVLGNTDTAIKGLLDDGFLANYLLNNNREPGKFGVSDEWNKTYANAREANATLLALKDKEKVGSLIENYATGQLKSLEKKKVSAGMLAAVAWAYQNNPKLLIESIELANTSIVNNFYEEFNVADGQKYVANRFASLKDDEKVKEAYEIGRVLYQSTEQLKAKKEAEKAEKDK